MKNQIMTPATQFLELVIKNPTKMFDSAPKSAARAAPACPFPSAKAMAVPIKIGASAAPSVFGLTANIQTFKFFLKFMADV